MIAIYIRVSTATQVIEGYSLQAQKERLTSFCKANGWDSYKFYVEEGVSAKNDKRPVYQEMMEHIKEGKINTLLVYRLDRIMRSIRDLDDMLKTLEDYKCSFKSATEPFDTTNPTGKLFIYIVGALAQWENEIKSERIKEVLEEKVANEGVWIGNVPYPFNLDENTQKLVPDPIRAQLTLDMIDKYKEGSSAAKIAEFMDEVENDKNWIAKTVIRILKNPALYGATRWVDEVYENTHEGIITKDEFEKIQEMMKDRSLVKRRDVKSIYLFQGKLVCPSCEGILTVNRYFRPRKDGTVFQGATYRCTNCFNSKKFRKSISEPSFLNALYSYMQNVKIERIENLEIKKETPIYVKQFQEIEQKRKKYQRAWASDLMNDDEFKSLMEETRKPYEELKEKVKNSNEPKPIDIEQVKNIVFTFNQNFKMLKKEEKRNFISSFIKRIEFKIIPQPPVRPDKSKRGKDKIVISNIIFY